MIMWLLPLVIVLPDHLIGLAVRVPGYRSRGPGFDSRLYQILLEVVGLERVPLSLVRIIESYWNEKLWPRSRKPRLTGIGTCCADHERLLHLQKSVLTSLTIGDLAVGIVRLWTRSIPVSIDICRRVVIWLEPCCILGWCMFEGYREASTGCQDVGWCVYFYKIMCILSRDPFQFVPS
jgi:hypothetical protein